MSDVWFLALTVGFFGLMVAFVRGCEGIIATDEVVSEEIAEVNS